MLSGGIPTRLFGGALLKWTPDRRLDNRSFTMVETMIIYKPSIVLTAVLCADLAGAQDYVGPNFERCQKRVTSILEGKEEWNGINNVTVEQYIYRGAVRGMNSEYEQTSRDKFITITTEGCKVLCESPVDFYWHSDITTTLSIISNWILPIMALLSALPYDSLHRRTAGAPWWQTRIMGTLRALLNWLGSPETALTNTLFNIHQMHECLAETKSSGQGISGNNNLRSLKMDAYYVLSCIGQFNMPDVGSDEFLEPLVYALFRGFVHLDAGEAAAHAQSTTYPPAGTTPDQRERSEQAKVWTRELLQEMAFQLRMLRRRGIYPSLVNVFLFCVAYAMAVVLAFSDVGERTTAHALALGILVSWLPLLVLFSILDRNPMSADRSRKLMSRWLWNADAIRRWEKVSGIPASQNPPPVMPAGGPPASPDWWTWNKEENLRALQLPPGHTPLFGPFQQPVRFDPFIGEFVGQGRQMGYHGLAFSVVHSVYDSHGTDRRMRSIQEIVEHTRVRLGGPRPWAWWRMAFISLTIVWLFAGMAFMISYNTPTVGFACRSGSYTVYGLLTFGSWFLSLLPCYKHPDNWMRAVAHAFNGLALLTLLLIIFASFSGIFNNCICKGGLAGYLDFESAEFYRNPNHFNVYKWWMAGAIVGALPITFSLLRAAWLLIRLKPLWQASEQHNPHVRNPGVDMIWLV
ncbi:hypothetical protein QC761_300030 [Podospora bellae-mahoneyi]|uniref:Uncharacterized protein n=1 Tax=Podospora bellae-mahoneyi TaxID=2093777 RepID=A0ABR0FM96_9PEZI|nr:hypothetical protein QC761_300030 [Podospora bellae-mahoneyi]